MWERESDRGVGGDRVDADAMGGERTPEAGTVAGRVAVLMTGLGGGEHNEVAGVVGGVGGNRWPGAKRDEAGGEGGGWNWPREKMSNEVMLLEESDALH